MKSIDAVHQDTLRRDLPAFRAGDTVRVHVNIKEGDKERIQIFNGTMPLLLSHLALKLIFEP